jgi:hypothetical protein
VRYALRVLARRPSFTLVAVVSLALAIGANAAIFSLMDALLWRDLPVREPETASGRGNSGGGGVVGRMAPRQTGRADGPDVGLAKRMSEPVGQAIAFCGLPTQTTKNDRLRHLRRRPHSGFNALPGTGPARTGTGGSARLRSTGCLTVLGTATGHHGVGLCRIQATPNCDF